MNTPSRHTALLACVLLSACADPSAPEDTFPNATIEELYPDGCDPIVGPEFCGYPFPSDIWTIPSDTSETGKLVRFHRTNMQPQRWVYEGSETTSYFQDPNLFDSFDGFSPGAQMIFSFAGATLEGTATVSTIERSLESDSPTVLLDAETGERVPHFVERDVHALDTNRQMILIRPVVRLRSGKRYVVAVRGLVDATGHPVAPTPAFRALRDDKRYAAHPSVAARRAHYETMFDELGAIGVDRGDLQLAWDFTTSSDTHNTERLVAMYEAALAELAITPAAFTITNVQDNVSADIARRIEGTVSVPMYLTDSGGSGATMRLAYGMPSQNGRIDVPFLLQIPTSAVAPPGGGGGAPKPILQHGHGLFGSRTEADGSEWRSFINDNGYVMLSMDWWGLNDGDLLAVATIATTGDVREFRTVPDRGQQAMLNFLYGLNAVMNGLVNHPDTQINGHPTIDPVNPRYMGVSLGGIYGSVYLTLSPDIDRGALMVPGQPFGLLLPRNSSTFPSLHYQLENTSLNDGAFVPLALEYVQMLWDRAEPDGYTHLMLNDPEGTLPFAHDHHVFVLDAIGDKTVTTLGAHIMARTLGLPNLAPVPRDVFGLTATTGPITGNAFAEFDFGPAESQTQIANPAPGDPHSALISNAMTAVFPRAMAANFLLTGSVSNLCSGSCSPD
jgi:hypothetical protein